VKGHSVMLCFKNLNELGVTEGGDKPEATKEGGGGKQKNKAFPCWSTKSFQNPTRQRVYKIRGR